MLEKLQGFVIDIFLYVFEAIIQPFQALSGLHELVFANEKYYLLFTPDEWNNLIVPGVELTITIAYFGIVFGLIYMALMVNKSAINPQTRINFLEMAGALLFAALLLNNLHAFYEIMMALNKALVSIFYADIKENGNLTFGDLSNNLGELFLYLCYLGLSLWANIYYLMRTFTIAILMILGPIFIVLFIFHIFRPITGAWMRELFSTIMVQSIHACILWIFLHLDDSVTENWLVKFVVLATFIPIAEGVKRLFTFSDDMTGRAAMMAAGIGASGLLTVWSAGRSALGKSSLHDTLLQRYGGRDREVAGSGGQLSGGQATASTSGATVPLSQTQPLSDKTARMLKVGSITANLGKAAGQLAGAAFGAPFGAEGVLAGGVFGGKFGKEVGGFGGRVATAMGQTGNALRKNINAAVNEELDKTDMLNESIEPSYLTLTGVRRSAAAAVLGTKEGIKRTFATRGTNAERYKQLVSRMGFAGAVIGGESGIRHGQAVGQWMGKKYQRNIESKGMEISDLIRSPYTNMRIAITNDSSYILGQYKDEQTGKIVERRITGFRGGDSSLKPGEVIYRDIHVTGGRIMDGHIGNNGLSMPLAPSPYYKEDSKGEKQVVSKNYNINPYDYFENRRNSGSAKYFHPNRSKQGIV
jgi:hypothetical protein